MCKFNQPVAKIKKIALANHLFTHIWGRAVARDQFPDELEILGAELVAVVHELDVLPPHAALDGRRHFQNAHFRICNHFSRQQLYIEQKNLRSTHIEIVH